MGERHKNSNVKRVLIRVGDVSFWGKDVAADPDTIVCEDVPLVHSRIWFSSSKSTCLFWVAGIGTFVEEDVSLGHALMVLIENIGVVFTTY